MIKTSSCIALALLSLLARDPAQAPGSNTTPPHRRHHAIVYDAAARRVLLFGGQHLVSDTEASMLADLWSWDGTRWTQVSANTGIATIAHRIYVDRAGTLFLVDGLHGTTARLDGARWRMVSDSTSRRQMAAAAFDIDRRRLVLFGGHIDGRAFPDDTLEFDGVTWRSAATTGPPGRFGASMAYDAGRKVTVMFGGLDSAGQKLGDIWEWNGHAWVRVPAAGPSPRFGAGFAYDARRGEAILFGGMDASNTKLNDTWRWDGRKWTRAATSVAPAPRTEGHMAFDAARGVIVMFGGEGTQTVPTLGDTWVWNGTRWTPVTHP